MEQQYQQPSDLELFTYQAVVGGLAKQASDITYNVLQSQGMLPANTNSAPSDSPQEVVFHEQRLLRYSALFSQTQYNSPQGKTELGLVQSGIQEKFGGLEGLLSLPEKKNKKNLGEIQVEAIKNAYSVGVNGSRLTPEESARNYVTNGDLVGESLSSIESMLESQLDDEHRKLVMKDFSIIARGDMYARALRAEQVFGVSMIGENNQLLLDQYAASSTGYNSGDRDAA